MLCLLLERLELSRGFNSLEKRTNRPHTSRITLLPSKTVIRHLNEAKGSLLGNMDLPAVSSVAQQAKPLGVEKRRSSASRPLTAKPAHPQSVKGAEIAAKQNPKTQQQVAQDNRMAKLSSVLADHHEQLMRTFVFYCSFGEPLNTNKLRSTKFIKLLRDSKILEAKPAPSEFKGTLTSGFMATGRSGLPHPRPLRQLATEEDGFNHGEQ